MFYYTMLWLFWSLVCLLRFGGFRLLTWAWGVWWCLVGFAM